MIYTLTLNPAIDRTIYVDEINKKDVTRVHKSIKDSAGKGINVSKVLKTLHLDSMCLGFIGGYNGRFIKNELNKKEIAFNFVEVQEEIRENIKLIVTDENKTIELNEKGPRINALNKQDLILKLDSLLKKDDILILSGSVPQGLDVNIYYEIIERYRQVFTIVDVSGEALKHCVRACPNVLKPNLYELEQYMGRTLRSEKTIIDACKNLVQQGIEQVIVTLGSKGAIYVSKEDVYKVELPTVNVKSTVGAGDSFVAGLAYGYCYGFSTVKVLQYSAAVAAASVLSDGTAIVDPIDVNDLIYHAKIKEL